MKVTINCDNENTIKFIDYIIRIGTCNCRRKELEEWGIEYDGSTLNVTYSLEVPPAVEMDVKVEQPKNKKKKNESTSYLYAARDIETGKLVSDITNPKRKYWDKEGNARNAIDYYNSYYANKDYNPRSTNKGKHGIIELVKFELVEVPVDAI